MSDSPWRRNLVHISLPSPVLGNDVVLRLAWREGLIGRTMFTTTPIPGRCFALGGSWQD